MVLLAIARRSNERSQAPRDERVNDASITSTVSVVREGGLIGPSPPPADAAVPDAAPRMLHGHPRRVHRSAARGPRRVKVLFRTFVGGAVASQVIPSPDESTLYVTTLGAAGSARADAE